MKEDGDNIFTYSYERLRKELIEKKSFEYSKYGKQTVLEWLSRTYLHDEYISKYEEIEWSKLRITDKVLAEMIKWIDNDYESARILFYFCNHPLNVLNIGAGLVDNDAVVEQFVDECCRLIDKIYHRNNHVLPKQLNGEVYPDIKRMSSPDPSNSHVNTMLHPYISVAHGAIPMAKFLLRDATLLPLLPIKKTEKGNGPFSSQTIFESALRVRTVVREMYITQKDEMGRNAMTAVLSSNDFFISQTRSYLTFSQNRMLRGRIQPVLQTLFVVCAYLALEENEPEFSSHYRECSKSLKTYLVNEGVKPEKIEEAIEKLQKALQEPFTRNKEEKEAQPAVLPEPEIPAEMKVVAYPNEARKIKAVHDSGLCKKKAHWGAVHKILVDYGIFTQQNYSACADLINTACGKTLISDQTLRDSPAFRIIGGNIKDGEWYNNDNKNHKSASLLLIYKQIAQLYLKA